MTQEYTLTGVVRPEVDDRQLDRETSRMEREMNRASTITPNLNLRGLGDKLRSGLESAIPGGGLLSGLGRGGSSGGSSRNSRPDRTERRKIKLQKQAVDQLEEIHQEIRKSGVSGGGGGGGGGILASITPGGGGLLGGLAGGGLASKLGKGGSLLGGAKTLLRRTPGGVLSPGMGFGKGGVYGDEQQQKTQQRSSRIREMAGFEGETPIAKQVDMPDLPSLSDMDWPSPPSIDMGGVADFSSWSWPSIDAPGLSMFDGWSWPEIDIPGLSDFSSWSWPDLKIPDVADFGGWSWPSIDVGDLANFSNWDWPSLGGDGGGGGGGQPSGNPGYEGQETVSGYSEIPSTEELDSMQSRPNNAKRDRSSTTEITQQYDVTVDGVDRRELDSELERVKEEAKDEILSEINRRR